MAGTGCNQTFTSNCKGDDDGHAILFLPVAGPFIDFAQSSGSDRNRALAIGLVQTTGLGFLALGLFTKQKVLALDFPHASVDFVPTFTASSGGVNLRLRL